MTPFLFRARLLGWGLIAAVLALAPPGAAASGDDEARRFADLVDREWRWRLAEFPTFATSVGVHDFDDRLGDESLAAYARRDRETAAFLAELDGIDAAVLSAADRIDAGIFRAQLAERREGFRFGDHLLTLNADSGFHTSFALLRWRSPSRRSATTRTTSRACAPSPPTSTSTSR